MEQPPGLVNPYLAILKVLSVASKASQPPRAQKISVPHKAGLPTHGRFDTSWLKTLLIAFSISYHTLALIT